ncbi:DNA repair protein Pso2/Snm1 [Trichophyton tonsurans CBS 112818]|uniref:DNA repair protein Pso2/Snm1 n=1 Tax=Trichophyton tonsurans (strain CBS 112818) TaxID=647933 RepID=F2S915_TRIT1|nr:DNA repair protein Pso2/Snm1 [Trichophyton tonsurans CBS 112818]
MPPTLTSPFFRPNGQPTKRPSPLSTAQKKPTPTRNRSILNFFKKSDTPPKPTQPRITEFGVRSKVNARGSRRPDISSDTSTGLFFEEETPNNSNTELQADGISCSDERYEVADMLWDSLPNSTGNNYREDDKYNESPGSVKRRRTSDGTCGIERNGPEGAASGPIGNDGDDSTSARDASRLESEDSSFTPTIARHGPFVDDSDSEDDRSPFCVDARDTNAGKILEIGDCTTQPFSLYSDMELPDDKRLEDSSCQSIDQPEREIGPGRDTPNGPESTLVPDEDSGHLAETFSDDEVTVCPICQTSLSRLSDSEASLHVNDCLDGINGNSATVISTVRDTQITQQPPRVLPRMKRKEIPRPGQKDPFSFSSASLSTSAFTKIMSANEEDTAWSVAASREEASRGKQAYERTCPFYKILPGFSITVDAFRYGAIEGCNAYFLSHYHSDHYGGLTSSWSHGPIYCSTVTANLVKQQIKVKPDMVVELEFERKTEIPGTDGVSVTMITANHCPGSSLFLFEKPIGKGKNARIHRILHCGDFRASSAHINHPLLRPNIQDRHTGKITEQKIDVCYLDTTYLNPKYAFPFQQDVINACAQLCVGVNEGYFDTLGAGKGQAKKSGSMTPFLQSNQGSDRNSAVDQYTRGKLLVVIGTYSIGKERICLGVARALNSKIYVSPNKKRICECLEDAELSSIVTSDPLDAQVHMHSLMDMRSETLSEYLKSLGSRFTRIIGIRPTGWSYRPRGGTRTDSPPVSAVLYSEAWKPRFSVNDLVPQRGSTNEAACFSVPYSEHSSFRELTMFCCALRISRIIPTVNVGSPKSREKMKYWIDKWEAEKKKNGLFEIEAGSDNKW